MNTLRSRFPLLQLDRIRYNRYNVAICAEISNPRTSLCRTVETGSRAGFGFRKQCFWAARLEFQALQIRLTGKMRIGLVGRLGQLLSGTASLHTAVSERLQPSRDTDGRPNGWRLFHLQYSRNPCRCQAITVSGLTMTRADRQPFHNRESQTHNSRSAILRRSDWVAEFQQGIVKVSVADVRVEHQVRLTDFAKWLERTNASQRGQARGGQSSIMRASERG